MEPGFWITQALCTVTHISIAYVNGLMVRHMNIKVNYTRKINHFLLFFFPIFIHSIVAYEQTLRTAVTGMSLMAASLIIYIKPVRERVSFINTAFLSFDRPEDRPYTLLWLSTQIGVATLIMIPLLMYFSSVGMLELIYIPILINGLGDGLAEPVGVRFGKHPYQTRALFTEKKFVRTYEGSACVLVVSLITVFLFRESFSSSQFWVAVTTLPILMTLAEAWSPHTWDTPVLYTVSGLSLSAILMI